MFIFNNLHEMTTCRTGDDATFGAVFDDVWCVKCATSRTLETMLHWRFGQRKTVRMECALWGVGVDASQKWRRGRDSNPRYAFDVYSLSRGAPSTTRPPLRCGLIICIRVRLQGLFAGFHIFRRLRRPRAAPAENRPAERQDDSARNPTESRFCSPIRRVGVPSWHSPAARSACLQSGKPLSLRRKTAES